MKIVIRTLPRSPRALGGEDQIGFMLQEAFLSLGHSCTISFEMVRSSADLIVSLGIGDRVPQGCSCSLLWYFNESFRPSEIDQLGYQVVVTNSVNPSQYGLPYRKLPLAAHRSMLPAAGVSSTDRGIAYIGNWSEYKQTAIDRYLIPLAAASGQEFSIYGGERWREHPVLGSHYRGILHPDSWPYLKSIARTWVAFRSSAQASMGMMPDRVYNLVAAGVSSVVTDGPIEEELSDMVRVENDPEAWVDAALNTASTRCNELGPKLIMKTANYAERAKRILELCTGT